MGEQIPAQQCDQVGERPVDPTSELQQLEQEHGDECRPNLNPHRVGRGSDEGLDAQVLFDGLEEQLDLPALAIDLGDGFRGEVEAVGQQFHLLALLLDPHRHPSEWRVDPAAGVEVEELALGIPKDFSARLDGEFLMARPERVLLEPGDESHALAGPPVEHAIVVVAAVHDDDRTLGQLELLGDGDIRDPALGDHGEGRQVSVVVEQQVKLGRALGSAELRPIEHARTEFDDGAVQRVELALESELLPRSVDGNRAEQVVEETLEEIGGPVGIGV